MARVQLNVWVEGAQRDAIKAKAAQAGVPVGRLIAEAVLGAAPTEASRTAVAVSQAQEALEQASAVANDLEGLERRLSRLEEMAGGQY